MHLNFFRHKGEEETDMKDNGGKEDGPGEDSTLLEGRRKEENPAKVMGEICQCLCGKNNLGNEFVVCPLGEIILY